ncbi:SRPBCC family protein [Streptomyces sp. NPDC050560]|uniref:SRPBCC family protein n=1 Tax=Streptomyces sp. NPDC050560 TaxID=3365630 RepID=UPI00378B9430
MRLISASVQIDAPPGQVYDRVADFARFHEWNPFVVRATGRAAPGSRLRLAFRLPVSGKEMEFTPKVLVADRGRQLQWLGRFMVPGVFDGLHGFTFEERDGGTFVVQSERFSGVLVPFTGSVVRQALQGFEELNRALKLRVESGEGAVNLR